MDTDWREEVLRRFKGRENLSKDEIYARFYESEGLPKRDVLECFELIEFEYEVPAGLLRPTDKLEKLFKPVPTNRPWRWMVYRTREGDSQTEINYELGKRMRHFGNIQAWSHIKRFEDVTIHQLLRAWCGLTPTSD